MVTPVDTRPAGARRLEGRVSIITGAGQGIGAATARRFGAEGAVVVIADKSKAGAERTQKQLEEHGVRTMVFLGDLSQWDTCHRLADEVVSRFGVIDILVNNVGGAIRSQWAWEFTEAQIKEEMERSFWPTLYCMHAVLPHMLRQGKGNIVNLGSTAVNGILRMPYAAAKGGVIALTTAVSKEVADKGIRINCVSPHGTDVNDRIVPRNDAPQKFTPEQEEERRSWALRSFGEGPLAGIDYVPMKRRGVPEEQAAAIAFLASDDASFITGQVLWVGS